MWGAGAVFLLALAAAALRNEANARRLAIATTLGTLLVIVLGYRIGETGGRLVYEHGAANAYVTSLRRARPAPGREYAQPRERNPVMETNPDPSRSLAGQSHPRRSPWRWRSPSVR